MYLKKRGRKRREEGRKGWKWNGSSCSVLVNGGGREIRGSVWKEMCREDMVFIVDYDNPNGLIAFINDKGY